MISKRTDTLSGDRHWLPRNLRRHLRLGVCALIFVVLMAALILAGMRPAQAVLLAFDIAALLFLAAVAWMFAHAKKDSMQRRARAQDENYWGFILTSVAVAAIALVALVVELHGSKHGGLLEIALAACTLLLTWLFTNTVFTLHYAHEFYGEGTGKHWGLDFPGTKEPDYWDFTYFAFCLGMTFQVSDVEISERAIRRVVAAHALIAFFFDVVIIALTVNVVAGIA